MTRDEIEAFFSMVHADTVGLTVDTAHLVKSGIDNVPAIIRDFQPVIDNLHLKDFAKGDWQVLGRGAIDFAPIFAAIREIGYDGWVCADEESGGDLVAGLQECHAFMRQGLCS
jgi:sugar phosphate isomerase/epimerase